MDVKHWKTALMGCLRPAPPPSATLPVQFNVALHFILCLILSHLISSHIIAYHLISSQLISSHLISSYLISSHPISSYLISLDCVDLMSEQSLFRLMASKLQPAAQTAWRFGQPVCTHVLGRATLGTVFLLPLPLVEDTSSQALRMESSRSVCATVVQMI